MTRLADGSRCRPTVASPQWSDGVLRAFVRMMALVNPIRIGARTSPLARAQADQVAGWLQARGWPTEFVGITTTGDVDQRALTQIGGTGVFVGAVREALYDRRDRRRRALAQGPAHRHRPRSWRWPPSRPREDTRDVLVGRTLDTLRDGDRIGTGSPAAGPAAGRAGRSGWASTLEVVEIRGNVDTRIGHAAAGSGGRRRPGRRRPPPARPPTARIRHKTMTIR